MKRGTPRHPKLAWLCDVLKLPLYGGVGILELLWHFTAEYAPEGDIGRHDDLAITTACGWKGKPEKLIRALIDTGWINEDPEYRLVIHDWHDHADNGTRKKLARAQKNFVAVQSGNLRPSIYFVHAPRLNRVKIGFTEGRVEARIETLQCGSPERLVLLGSIEGTRYRESQLHRRWDAYRVAGEWFEVRDDFESFLQDTVQFGGRKNPKLSTESNAVDPPRAGVATPMPVPVPVPVPQPADTHTVSAAAPNGACVTAAADRFPTWFDGYRGRKADPDGACREWISLVKTHEDADKAFACRDRYNCSAEVARGVCMEAKKFIATQAGNGWQGDWPPPARTAMSQSTSRVAANVKAMEKRHVK